MTTSSMRMHWLGLLCAGMVAGGGEATAQTAATAAQTAQSAANYQNMSMGMGMGMMAMPGMFGSPAPSATDAAALGMTDRPAGGMFGTGGGTMGNPYMSPMALPFLYGTMNGGTLPGMTQQQTAFTMLAGQASMLGLGSGQLSGVRPGPISAGSVRARQTQATAGVRGTTRQPGGLAARYFNRTAQKPRIPQGFYNRPNQHYPQVAR